MLRLGGIGLSLLPPAGVLAAGVVVLLGTRAHGRQQLEPRASRSRKAPVRERPAVRRRVGARAAAAWTEQRARSYANRHRRKPVGLQRPALLRHGRAPARNRRALSRCGLLAVHHRVVRWLREGALEGSVARPRATPGRALRPVGATLQRARERRDRRARRSHRTTAVRRALGAPGRVDRGGRTPVDRDDHARAQRSGNGARSDGVRVLVARVRGGPAASMGHCVRSARRTRNGHQIFERLRDCPFDAGGSLPQARRGPRASIRARFPRLLPRRRDHEPLRLGRLSGLPQTTRRPGGDHESRALGGNGQPRRLLCRDPRSFRDWMAPAPPRGVVRGLRTLRRRRSRPDLLEFSARCTCGS